ncbi:MAG: hypothetical protein R3E50_06370 [Halioglobus sp.]
MLSLALFLLLVLAVFYRRPALSSGSVLILAGAGLLTLATPGMWILLLPTALLVALLNVPAWRRRFLVKPVYTRLQGVLPPMSTTEQEALAAGTTWWEKDLFSGCPDWEKFDRIALPQLTAAEQSFLDVEVEELCRLIDDWDVQQRHDLSEDTWKYLRDKGFSGSLFPRNSAAGISALMPRAG